MPDYRDWKHQLDDAMSVSSTDERVRGLERVLRAVINRLELMPPIPGEAIRMPAADGPEAR